MAGSESQISNASLAPKVLQLLAEQQQSPARDVINRHVGDILGIHEREAAHSQELCLTLLRDLLGVYAKQLPADNPRQVEVRILQLRLAQKPDCTELENLRSHILTLAQQAEIFVPEAGAEPSPPSPVAAAIAMPTHVEEQPTPPPMAGPARPPSPAEAAPAQVVASEDRRVDVVSRRHLDEKRARILQLQETLASQVKEVIKQNERFGALLSSEHRNLVQTEDIESLQQLKELLIGEVTTLREGHDALAKKLETAGKYLQIIESEGQYLNDELTRVHILSLTDELTELPNRRAFMRRLEDEVARVQRYGYPLSLALVDIDGFKAVNDKYGHAAGDEVLRNFSTNILSIFRHHDMVARYGGEEFAVLLPNTDKAGALRALEKVKKRNSESSYQFEGKAMPMPTFSAGISLYKPGETPGSLIERADKALYGAKRMGRNRIELAQHDGADSTPH